MSSEVESSSESNSGNGGSVLGTDIDWGTLYAPGDIKVGDPDRRRLLEELELADNPRIRFFDDAARLGDTSDE